jgi:hypothetical protein
MKKQRHHYLLTYELFPGRLRMHAYLMVVTPDKQRARECLDHALERLIDEGDKFAEKTGFKILAPIILSTDLTTGADVVREIVMRNFPQTKKNMTTAKEVHFTVWCWAPETSPDDAKLMELH